MTRCLITLLIAIGLLTACGGGQNVTVIPEPTNTSPPTDTPTPTPTATPLPTATPIPSPTATATPVPPTATATAVPATATPTEIAIQTDKNVAYVPDGHAKQKLDVYLPGGSSGPFPTLLMIHGGYGDKRDMTTWARYFADRGYAVISINHRELPQDTYPAPVEDTFCALAWVHTNAQEHGFDPQHVFALGHSAGGTLAAMLGTVDDPSLFLQDCPYSLPESDWVQAIIPFTGIFDYAQVASDSIGLRQYSVEYLGAEPDDAPDRWAEASPLTWVDGSEPPFLLVHGLDDKSIPPDQSKEFAAALTKAGVETELWLVPRADHMAIIRDQESFEAVETFLTELITTTATAPTNTSLGDTLTRSTDGMIMVYVPAGEFEMGSDEEEIDLALEMCNTYYSFCSRAWFEVEGPVHTVTLDGFWIDQTEVTNAQYQRCVEAGACRPPTRRGSETRSTYYADSAYDDYPVIYTPWDQANAYCQWAGARLPTEAEWEYAARGPEGRRFPWGDEYDGTRLNSCDVNCQHTWAEESFDDGYSDTAPVGSYPEGASWCGALDLAGNAWEWMADWFEDYTSEGQTNPTGPASGTTRALRGDAADGNRAVSRCTARHGMTPSRAYQYSGFRCAMSP